MRFFNTIVLAVFFNVLLAQSVNTTTFNPVNTSYDELQPVLSADHRMLFFTVANHPDNIGGKKDPGDIWYSVQEGDHWTAPVHAGPQLNDRGYNAVAGMSADGRQLFLLSHYSASGDVSRTQGLAISKYDGNRWMKPENINIPYFQNKSGMLQGFVTPDKGVFVFAAETYGTRGVEDIYVSLNEDGRWTEPKNLGGKINTPFQEMSPALSADGKTLYFSSNGRKGKGSFDVYASTRLDDSWSNWSEPVNVEDLNTEGRELFYRPYADQNFSIFTTTKNSDGYGDINLYEWKKPTDSIMAAIDTATIDKKQPPLPEAGEQPVMVYGKVINVKTGEGLEADITIMASNVNESITATPAGGFSVTIPNGKTYSVRVQAKGYVSAFEQLDIRDGDRQQFEMNFKLQPVEVGTTVNLKSVLFERGTSNLLPESNNELDMVVSFLKANPSVKIELKGHTDNRGVHADNIRLSQERVDRVKEYLVSNGIDARRISGKGYGGLKPIASNDTEETRRLNRRVEFMIKKF